MNAPSRMFAATQSLDDTDEHTVTGDTVEEFTADSSLDSDRSSCASSCHDNDVVEKDASAASTTAASSSRNPSLPAWYPAIPALDLLAAAASNRVSLGARSPPAATGVSGRTEDGGSGSRHGTSSPGGGGGDTSTNRGGISSRGGDISSRGGGGDINTNRGDSSSRGGGELSQPATARGVSFSLESQPPDTSTWSTRDVYERGLSSGFHSITTEGLLRGEGLSIRAPPRVAATSSSEPPPSTAAAAAAVAAGGGSGATARASDALPPPPMTTLFSPRSAMRHASSNNSTSASARHIHVRTVTGLDSPNSGAAPAAATTRLFARASPAASDTTTNSSSSHCLLVKNTSSSSAHEADGAGGSGSARNHHHHDGLLSPSYSSQLCVRWSDVPDNEASSTPLFSRNQHHPRDNRMVDSALMSALVQTSAVSQSSWSFLPRHHRSQRDVVVADSALMGGTSSSELLGVEGSSPSQAHILMRSFTSTFKHMAVGDDDGVKDKWLPFESSIPTSLKKPTTSHQESGVVVPLDESLSGTGAERNLQRKSSMTRAESSSRGFRTLLWYYFQMFLYSVVVAVPILLVIFACSRVTWHLDNNSDDGTSVFLPNRTPIMWTLFAQCLGALILYCIVLYMAIRKTLRLPWQLMATAAVVTGYTLLAVGLLWHFRVPVWYYYLDSVLMTTVFLPMTCCVAWVALGPDATFEERMGEIKYIALLESLVTVATMVYTALIIPHFYTLRHAWQQLLWVVFIHPLYFEVTTAAIMRKALFRQALLGRSNVTDFLPLVHMMVHLVGLGIALQGSIEPVGIMALSLLCTNIGKLLWRSTVLWRDLLIQKIVRWDWKWNYENETRLEMSKLISLAIMTELVLDNAAIMSGPFMMWAMYKEPIFMSVVPNTFYNNNGTYPVAALLAMIAMMFGFTWVSDVAFFCLNYYTGQRLPIIYTWRKIKDSKWSYLGFISYAMATMGVMFNFSMMLILPRAAYCHSNDYCDCILPVYDAVCHGEHNSMLVDYLLGNR